MYLQAMPPLHGRNRTVISDTSALKAEEANEDDNGYAGNNSPTVEISGDVRTLCKQGRLKEALHILHFMDYQSFHIGFSIYASLLQVCVIKTALPEGKLVHAHIIQTGHDISIGNKLLSLYTKCRSMMDARRVFDQMSKRDVVSWTVLIAAYARHGFSEEALTLFSQMKQIGIHPDQFTLAGVLPACAKLAALEPGKEIHEELIRSGFQSDVYLGNALVVMYGKCGSLENARQVFDKMSEPNVISWNVIIAGYAQNGHFDEALKLFEKMPERDVVSWNAMITGYAQNGHVNEALNLFQVMPERNVVSWNAMIAGYAQNGRLDEALKLFQTMPEQSIVSWTSIITGYAQNGQVDEALELFQKMPAQDVVSWNAMIALYAQNGNIDEAFNLFQKMPERDLVSWNTIIAGYAQNGKFDEALKLFEKMPERDVVSWNAMIAGYVQKGDVNDALNLFRKMPARDAVSWTAMIAGYTQNAHFDEALKLFGQMQLAGVKPNSDTFASILPACANLAALEQGKEVHEDIIRSGFQSDVFVGSALVDMYAKCGSLEDACRVFGKMPRRNVVSWNAMIVAYAMHGCGKEALQLFEQMKNSGMTPDHITFVGVLSACCHAGLVDDGFQYFDCMSQSYHITPAMEHYCCMVDLLGRAGCLDEAQNFIKRMPVKPNAAVWGSLLGACRIHGNIELSNHVAERLLELEPENAAHYVLLSNIYAAAGRWDDIENVRKIMKDRRVKKKPGCSWIEVNKEVYAFHVGDRSHPQTHMIYAELERLSGQMKEAGYVSDTRFALNDVEEEQKENILCHHSEKLAIAFGLISTSPGTPIRIIKNLRVCGDCHSAIKFISKIYMRDIVVRDANRFHHFKDGRCSCGDYW
eukprot:Gb_25357 [translate_table: standard]